MNIRPRPGQCREWAQRFWLMDHLGANWNGRWWSDSQRDFADFALEPGRGYYYVRRTNQWGAADFDWVAPTP